MQQKRDDIVTGMALSLMEVRGARAQCAEERSGCVVGCVVALAHGPKEAKPMGKRIIQVTAIVCGMLGLFLLLRALFLWPSLDIFGSHADNLSKLITSVVAVLGVAVLVFLLYQFIRYAPRSNQFLIESVEGDSTLVSKDSKPLNMTLLAQEALTVELENLRQAIVNYTHSRPEKGQVGREITKQPTFRGRTLSGLLTAYGSIADLPRRATRACIPAGGAASQARTERRHIATKLGLSVDADSAQRETTYELLRIYLNPGHSKRQYLARLRQYVPPFESRGQAHGLPQTMARAIQRKSVISAVIASKHADDLLRAATEMAPDAYSPIARAVQAMLPARTTRITGYLQHDPQSNSIGITWEFTGNQENRDLLRTRTIWSGMGTGSSTVPLTAQYLEILQVSVRWLALTIWESQLTSQARHFWFRPHARKHYLAETPYLCGGLYRASAEDYEEYADFFCRVALERLLAARDREASWFLPYALLGNLFRWQFEHHRTQHRAFEDALWMLEYGRSLACTSGEEHDIYSRFSVYIARLRLLSDKAEDVAQARDILDTLLAEVPRRVPAAFDADLEDAATYLNCLACAYSLSAARRDDIANSKAHVERALRYLAYSLACNADHYLWADAETDPTLACVREQWSIQRLTDELECRRSDLEEILRTYPAGSVYDTGQGTEYIALAKRRDEFARRLEVVLEPVVQHVMHGRVGDLSGTRTGVNGRNRV